MALPTDALTATVTVGASTDVTGAVATVSDLTITPLSRLVWAATGDAIEAVPAEPGATSAVILADQPGVLTSSVVDGEAALVEVRSWPLVARWRTRVGEHTRSHERRFSAPAAGTALDLDLLPESGARVPGTVTYAQTINIGTAASTHSHAVTDVTGLQTALDGKAPTTHTHDDRYYTETEVDTLLAGKADASHTHGAPLRTITATAATSITATASDHGKLIQTTAATAVTVELPAGLPVGTQIEYQASGAGLATFTLGASASWSPAPTPSAVMRAQGSAVVAICVATNAWALIGDLA